MSWDDVIAEALAVMAMAGFVATATLFAQRLLT